MALATPRHAIPCSPLPADHSFHASWFDIRRFVPQGFTALTAARICRCQPKRPAQVARWLPLVRAGTGRTIHHACRCFPSFTHQHHDSSLSKVLARCAGQVRSDHHLACSAIYVLSCTMTFRLSHAWTRSAMARSVSLALRRDRWPLSRI